MTFSEKLITLRAGRGWSQEKLAGELGVTRQAVGRWERGECLPDAVGLTNLARAFDIAPEWLLDDNAPDAPEPRRVRRVKLAWFDWLMFALVPVSIAAYVLLSAWELDQRASTYSTPAWFVWVSLPLSCLRFISACWSAAAAVGALFIDIRPRDHKLCVKIIAVCSVLIAVYVIGGTALTALGGVAAGKFVVLFVTPAMRRPYLLAMLSFLLSAVMKRKAA